MTNHAGQGSIGRPSGRTVELGSQARAFARSIRLLPWLGLGIASVLPYVNALHAGFVFDDWIQIRGNPAVTSELDWFKILAVPLFPGNLYRPLTVATFALDRAWFGWEAWWFHAVNIALHAGVSLLVAAIGLRLFPRSPATAWLAAAIFAVHPQHTEAVTGLVGRAELLATLFGLATLLCLERGRGSSIPWRMRGWMALALTSFTLALLAKESALTVLPLALLYVLAVSGTWSLTGLGQELFRLDWLAFLACAAAVLVLRGLAVGFLGIGGEIDPVDNILASVPVWQRVATALAVQWEYFSQFCFPLVLSADYSYPQIVPVAHAFHPATWATVALIVGVGWVAWRAEGPVAFAALFPLVAFSLTSNLLFPIGTVRGDRLAYFPSIAWCWWLAGALCLTRRWLPTPVMGALAVSLLVAYGLRTYERNADWTDQATLFTRTAQDSPYSSKAHKNYAVALRDAGRFDEARLAYQRAWELYPRDEGIAFGLGEVCDRLGRSSEAELWYRKALAIDPKHVGSWNNLCRLYVLQGRWAEAEQACRAGLRQNAAHANLWKGLGLTWLNRGNADAGREALLIALRLAPKDESLRGYIESLAAPKEDDP